MSYNFHHLSTSHHQIELCLETNKALAELACLHLREQQITGDDAMPAGLA
jgi:hypothetical protein